MRSTSRGDKWEPQATYETLMTIAVDLAPKMGLVEMCCQAGHWVFNCAHLVQL
jgi:hypothetical protein